MSRAPNKIVSMMLKRDEEIAKHHGVSKSERARKTREEKFKRARDIPAYEQVSDWRGIESALSGPARDAYHLNLREEEVGDNQSASGPGFYEDPKKRAEMALSPLEISQTVKPQFLLGDMQSAIQSAMTSMKTHLEGLIKDEETNVTGQKSRNEETHAQYAQKAQQLINQYIRQNESVDSDNIVWSDFAEWLVSRQLDLSAMSWRIYKSSVMAMLERIPTDDAAYAMALLKSEDETGEAEYSESRMQRIKRFTPEDFDRALYACITSNTEGSNLLAHYLRANIRVGLRPKEFLTSEIRYIKDDLAPHGRQVWMFVCNAKYSNGRANGPIRSIDLTNLDSAAIEAISVCINDARIFSAMNGYHEWLRRINNHLRRVCRNPMYKIKGEYTAYSVRHQAIANWKANYDPVAVAALAGHAFPRTTQSHYGKASDAWSKERLNNILVRASAADIKRIENRIEIARARQSVKANGYEMDQINVVI